MRSIYWGVKYIRKHALLPVPSSTQSPNHLNQWELTMGDDPNHGFVTSVGCWTHEVGRDLGLDEDVFTKQDIN